MRASGLADPARRASLLAVVLACASCKQILGLEEPHLDEGSGAAATVGPSGSTGGGASSVSAGGIGGAGAGASSASAGGGGTGAAGGSGQSYASVVMADGPLGYWRFDETSGSTAKDETSGGHDGTFTGPLGLGQPGAIVGEPGASVHFDGTGYVDMGDAFDFTGASSFSLEAWIEPESPIIEFEFVISKEGPDGLGRQGYDLWAHQMYGVGFERFRDDVKDSANLDGVPPSSTEFTHVVATYDGAKSTLVVYVNGTVVATDSTVNMLSDNTESFGVGASESGGDAYFIGLIDEVAVYGYPLTEQQVVAHHFAGTMP